MTGPSLPLNWEHSHWCSWPFQKEKGTEISSRLTTRNGVIQHGRGPHTRSENRSSKSSSVGIALNSRPPVKISSRPPQKESPQDTGHPLPCVCVWVYLTRLRDSDLGSASLSSGADQRHEEDKDISDVGSRCTVDREAHWARFSHIERSWKNATDSIPSVRDVLIPAAGTRGRRG